MFKSLKGRRRLRRLSITSKKIKITTQIPWPLKVVLFIAFTGIASGISFWAFQEIKRLAVPSSSNDAQSIETYKDQIEKLRAERDQFSTIVNAAENQLNIERSAQKQLAAQVKILEADNIKLKEDLAFFDSLLPNTIGTQGISIRRFKIDLVTPTQVRYRLLIMQGGKGERDFIGDLQFTATLSQGGKNVILSFPERNSAEAKKLTLAFRHYQRVEGNLTIPEGSSVKLIQVRVLEKGQVRAQSSTSL